MIEVILMQRVEKLGQMGEVVKVRPGYARNFLLPQGKAIRASEDNLARFEQDRARLEAQNLKRREEAERVAERVQGLSVTIIRSAGESGGLYGSGFPRDRGGSPEEAEKQARGEEIAREEEPTLEDELRAELGAAVE